ncbi:MAG: lysine--tRNA ligase [Planctomycetes bacterium]|nr:lysine--tRNA ligase [Planctomycetota bacterium]
MGEPIPPERLKKLELYLSAGIDPYPKRFPARGEERDRIAALPALLREDGEAPAIVAGRVRSFRDFGKACFFDLKYESGRVQVLMQRDRVGAERYAALRKAIDLNDWLGVKGGLGRTRTGEVTVFADEVVPLCKSLRPPPEKWHGLQDVEARYRSRHVDLNVNEEVAAAFRLRSAVLAETRRFLDGRGFLEVETPVLQRLAGGAAARPFHTRHNALGVDLTLRIALELHLKRLLVGGMEKVYEIGRVFRNEGIDASHNPEFTMLELYWAFADYEDVMGLWEELLVHLARTVRGGTTLVWGGAEIRLEPPFARLRYEDLLKEHAGVDLDDEAAVRRRCAESGIAHEHKSHHKAANDLFELYCEKKLVQPTFVTCYPRGITPLAKWTDRGGDRAERFELFAGGRELANAFSEMNDAIEQRRILEAQVREKDPENPPEVDEEFLAALEYGMPPAGGVGMGMDRLVMMLSGSSNIRDVVLFPLLRPRAGEGEAAREEQP